MRVQSTQAPQARRAALPQLFPMRVACIALALVGWQPQRAHAQLTGGPGAGQAISRDFDGDGVPDLLVPRPAASGAIAAAGEVRVYSGATREMLYRLVAGEPNDLFGITADALGDIDGDGRSDIIVGAPRATATSHVGGAFHIFSGADGALLHSIVGNAFERLGRAVAGIGDVNHDDIPDFAVSLLLFEEDEDPVGIVQIRSGDAPDVVLATLAGGPDPSFGSFLRGLGDCDGDGSMDLAVTAPVEPVSASELGAVRVFLGDQTLPVTQPSRAWSDADSVLTSGRNDVNDFGRIVFLGKDVDADGRRELVIGNTTDMVAAGPRRVFRAFDLQSGAVKAQSEPAQLWIKTDKNGDLITDTEDVIEIVEEIQQTPPPASVFTADIDGDGLVTAADIAAVISDLGVEHPLKALSHDGADAVSAVMSNIWIINNCGGAWPMPGGSPRVLPVDFGNDVEPNCCVRVAIFNFLGSEWEVWALANCDETELWSGGETLSPNGRLIIPAWIMPQWGAPPIVFPNVPRPGDEPLPGEPGTGPDSEEGGGGGGGAGGTNPFNMLRPERRIGMPRPNTGEDEIYSDASQSEELMRQGPDEATCNPVLLAEGIKQEVDVDLHVPLPGRDFKLTRTYDGGAALMAPTFPWMIGGGWGASVDGWLRWSERTLPAQDVIMGPGSLFDPFGETLEVIRFPLDQGSKFHMSPGDSSHFIPYTPSAHTVTRGLIEVRGEGLPVWVYDVPGKGQAAFYNTRYATDPGLRSLEGRIVQERDAFGNKWTYTYASYTTPQGYSRPLLQKIDLASAGEGAPNAIVEFEWDVSANPLLPGSGRCREARVLRRVGSQYVKVQYARYTYRRDILALPGVYPGQVPHLGPLNTCLVLVEQGTMVNAPASDATSLPAGPEYHVRFTHYRYDSFQPPGEGSLPVPRLTHVYEPLQIERYAEQWAPIASGLSQAEALRQAAMQLVRLGTGAQVAPGAGRTVGQLAGKIITYGFIGEGYEREDGELMVRSEQLLNGCSCAGSDGQDMRIDFTYARRMVWDHSRRWEDPSVPVGHITSLRLGRWSRVTIRRESHRDPDNGAWRVNKTIANWSEDRPLGLGMAVAILDPPPLSTRSLHLTFELIPFVTANAVFEGDWPTAHTREWWTFHEFETGNLPVRTFHATALQGMEVDQHGLLAYAPFYNRPFNLRDAIQFKPGGLVEWREHDDIGRERRAGVARSTANGQLTDSVTTVETDYLSTDAPGPSNDARADLVSRVTRYTTTQPGSAVPKEETEFIYGLRNTPGLRRKAISWMIERRSRETPQENGPSAEPFVQTGVAYDNTGESRWTLAPDGVLTYNFFDERTGALMRSVRNAAPADGPNLPPALEPSQARHADGGSLETLQLVDLLARPLVRINEQGLRTAFSYALSRPELPQPFDPSESPALAPTRVPLLHVTTTPHDMGAGAAPRYAGPRVEQWADAAFNVVRSSSFEQGTPRETARIVQLHDLGGRLTESRTWHDIAANLSTIERFETDPLGRPHRTIDGVGQYTRYRHDLHDRVTEVLRGVIGGGEQVVERRFYDHTGPLSAPVHGAGDGNLTLVQRLVSDTGYRSEVNVYDWRKRLRLSYAVSGDESEALPGVYTATIFDNADRPLDVASVTGGNMDWLLPSLRADSLASFSHAPTMGSAQVDRITSFRYSKRGLVYEQRTRVFPPGDTSWSGRGMTTRTWYDGAGRVLAVLGPSDAVAKTRYDGLGRVSRTAVTDGRSMRTGNPTFEQATSPDGPDATLEETLTAFDPRGVPTLVTARHRRHDAPETDAGLSDAYVSTFAATVYDAAARPIATVDFGSGADAGPGADHPLAAGGAPPTLPLTAPPARTDSVRVVETRYDAIGRPFETIDELGRASRTLFDDAGRSIATIDNYTAPAGGPISVERDALGLWRLVGYPSSSASDQNRIVSLRYDAAGAVTHRIAHNVEAGQDRRQVTRHIYTPVEASSDQVNGLSNAAVSNRLLLEVRYPDTRPGASEGLPSTLAQDRVRFAYNRLGETTAKLDQNGALFVYTRDASGRIISERIEDRGASQAGIDLTAREVVTDYDRLGRVTSTRLTRGVAGPALNEIRTTYDFMGRPAQIRQSPLGPMSHSGALDIDFEWLPVGPGYQNRDRLVSITYPSAVGAPERTRLALDFGAPGSLDDLASRIVGFSWAGGAHSVSHARVGSARRVVSAYSSGAHSLVRDRAVDPGTGARAPGVYPGLDHFGRVRRHLWTLGALAGAPTCPPLVDLHYLYDAAGNTTARTDVRPGVEASRSERHRYDGLDRLVESARGASLATPLAGSERWSLDRIGNWTSAERMTPLAVTGYDSSESFQTNASNEIVARTPLAGVAQAFEYDPSGNLRSQRLPDATDAQGVPTQQRRRSFTYDAWGRLLKVALQTSPPGGSSWTTSRTLAAYTYYAGGQRATRTARFARVPADAESDEGSGADEPDERTLYCYDPDWRSLEEHTEAEYDGPWSNAPATAAAFAAVPSASNTRITQHVWDPTVQDELVQVRLQNHFDPSIVESWWAVTDRRRDVVALVRSTPDPETGGPIVQRVRYSSWGLPSFEPEGDIDADGTVTAEDSLALIDRLGATLGDPSGLYRADADLDCDGDIDPTDAILLGRWHDQRPNRGALWDYNVPTSIAYAGAHYDRATGLVLMRHRWLDPELGRWISRDPAGYVDGMSLYWYCTGNPVAYWDPFGLCPPDSVMDRRARAAAEMAEDVAEHAKSRADNIVAGATAGAATAGPIAAAVGAGVGSIGAGIGALPGAGIGFVTGTVGGAITGALRGFFSTEGETPHETAEKAAVGGVMDGVAVGMGVVVSKAVRLADEVADGAKSAVAASDKAIPALRFSKSQTPELADNILNAQKAGHPSILTHGGNAQANRKAALNGIPNVKGLSRDEYPFASAMEGGAGAWVGHIPRQQQNIQGGKVRQMIMQHDLQPGDIYRVIIGP